MSTQEASASGSGSGRPPAEFGLFHPRPGHETSGYAPGLALALRRSVSATAGDVGGLNRTHRGRPSGSPRRKAPRSSNRAPCLALPTRGRWWSSPLHDLPGLNSIRAPAPRSLASSSSAWSSAAAIIRSSGASFTSPFPHVRSASDANKTARGKRRKKKMVNPAGGQPTHGDGCPLWRGRFGSRLTRAGEDNGVCSRYACRELCELFH
jgi:hypothetical protein